VIFVGREVILVTHQPDKSWLKEFAKRNIILILVTLEISQFPMSWLKAVAKLLESNIDAVQSDLDQMQPRDRVNALFQFLKFHIPTQ